MRNEGQGIDAPRRGIGIDLSPQIPKLLYCVDGPYAGKRVFWADVENGYYVDQDTIRGGAVLRARQ